MVNLTNFVFCCRFGEHLDSVHSSAASGALTVGQELSTAHKAAKIGDLSLQRCTGQIKVELSSKHFTKHGVFR